MILQMIGLAVALWAAGGQAAPAPTVDVTGAWSVTITMPQGQVAGLAILSQDGPKITGMLGPAETDMFPVEGTVSANTVTLVARPRTGRTAAFATCQVTVEGDLMTGTIDSDKGKIEFVKRRRSGG
jgi:hypothetical protein